MKDILTTAFGMVLFNDATASEQTLAGIGTGLFGGMAYSYFSYCDMKKEAFAKEVITFLAHAEIVDVLPAGGRRMLKFSFLLFFA